MTANAVTGGSRSPGPNPMAGLQRQAFGFGGTSSNVQLALSVVGPIAAVLLTWGRVHWLGFLAAVLLPTPALLAILALRHRSRWAAQDVLFWLNDVAAADWQRRTGSRMPRNSVEANAWLGGRAESDVPLDCWVAALLMAGLVDESPEAPARLPIGNPSE